MTKIILIFSLFIAASCGTAKNGDELKNKIALLTCDISLTKARENLEKLGYLAVISNQSEVVTDYKISEKERERFWLGASRRDYYRRMSVKAEAPERISFNFDYKVLIHAHPTEDAEERTESLKIDPVEMKIERLREIREEVCTTLPEKSVAETADKEMITRCNDGNPHACIYLYNTMEIEKPKEAIEYLKKGCAKKRLLECSKLD